MLSQNPLFCKDNFSFFREIPLRPLFHGRFLDNSRGMTILFFRPAGYDKCNDLEIRLVCGGRIWMCGAWPPEVEGGA